MSQNFLLLQLKSLHFNLVMYLKVKETKTRDRAGVTELLAYFTCIFWLSSWEIGILAKLNQTVHSLYTSLVVCTPFYYYLGQPGLMHLIS